MPERTKHYPAYLTHPLFSRSYSPDILDDDIAGGGFLPFGIVLPAQAMLGIMGGILVCLCCCCSCIKHKTKKRWKRQKKEKEEKKKKVEEEMEKKRKEQELPEIAGSDLEVGGNGMRNNRGKDAGAGFTNAARKGLAFGHKGLDKVKSTGMGGPAVGLALKGVKMAEKKMGGGEEGGEGGAGSSNIKLPPPQLVKPPVGNPMRKEEEEAVLPPPVPQEALRPPSGLQPPSAEKAAPAADALPPPPAAAVVRPPPPPLKKKKSLLQQWFGFKDEGSGENYYENQTDGRVTWTEPKEGFEQK